MKFILAYININLKNMFVNMMFCLLGEDTNKMTKFVQKQELKLCSEKIKLGFL